MELYQEILSNMIRNHKEESFFPAMAAHAAWNVGSESYRALQKIKAVLDDDGLDDETCFRKIEEIICIFEELGSDGGSRHDFG